MITIELDAAKWTDGLAYYEELLSVLQAPDWHGRNINALIDSVIWGEINGVEPPYLIRVRNLNLANAEARNEFGAFLECLLEQREAYFEQNGSYPDVTFEIVA